MKMKAKTGWPNLSKKQTEVLEEILFGGYIRVSNPEDNPDYALVRDRDVIKITEATFKRLRDTGLIKTKHTDDKYSQIWK